MGVKEYLEFIAYIAWRRYDVPEEKIDFYALSTPTWNPNNDGKLNEKDEEFKEELDTCLQNYAAKDVANGVAESMDEVKEIHQTHLAYKQYLVDVYLALNRIKAGLTNPTAAKRLTRKKVK